MMDTFSRLKGSNQFGVITGKPLILGGSLGRNEATAQGCVYTIIKAAEKLNLTLEGASVAVQGYGNAGFITARLLHELGCKLVAVSDSCGAVYNADGIDPHLIYDHKRTTGSCINYQDYQRITNEELLELPVDIFRDARLFCDLPEQSLRIGEFQHTGPEATPTAIGAVLSGDASGRGHASEITIFDSSGISLQDLHMAKAILDRHLGSGAADS